MAVSVLSIQSRINRVKKGNFQEHIEEKNNSEFAYLYEGFNEMEDRIQDLIQEVNIPMETVKEITDSGEKTVERKVFPGYVLVKMVLTDESWHLVHNVRGAAGFVGSDGKAIPLTEQEIYDLGVEHHEVVVGYELGDSVKITDGPLEGFIGTVDELEPDKDRVRVVVSMFGRETPVDLELDQVEAIKD